MQLLSINGDCQFLTTSTLILQAKIYGSVLQIVLLVCQDRLRSSFARLIELMGTTGDAEQIADHLAVGAIFIAGCFLFPGYILDERFGSE